jgi:hypothetical protein
MLSKIVHKIQSLNGRIHLLSGLGSTTFTHIASGTKCKVGISTIWTHPVTFREAIWPCTGEPRPLFPNHFQQLCWSNATLGTEHRFQDFIKHHESKSAEIFHLLHTAESCMLSPEKQIQHTSSTLSGTIFLPKVSRCSRSRHLHAVNNVRTSNYTSYKQQPK